MLAYNPLKRRAEEPLLPLYAPKRRRSSFEPPQPSQIATRWISLSENVVNLVRDTGIFMYFELTSVVSGLLGHRHEEPTVPNAELELQQTLDDHPSHRVPTSPLTLRSPFDKTKPLKSAMKRSRPDRVVVEPCNFLPSPPPSSASSETSARYPSREVESHKRRTVSFLLSPPPSPPSRTPAHNPSNNAGSYKRRARMRKPRMPVRHSYFSFEDILTLRQVLSVISNTLNSPAHSSQLPTPPPSVASASPLSNALPDPALNSQLPTPPTSVTSAPTPHPQLPTPPPTIASVSFPSATTTSVGLYTKLDDADTAAMRQQAKSKALSLHKVRYRAHILHSQYEAGVKGRLKLLREDIDREAYLLRKRTCVYRHVYAADDPS